MRIRLGAKFRFLDERVVRCPFFEDEVLFTIARINNAGYQKAMDAWREGAEKTVRPIGNAYVEARARAQMLAAGRGLRGEPYKRFVDEKTEELFGKLDMDFSEEMATYDNTDALASHLIRNVTGLVNDDTGDAIDYTAEVGKNLLQIDVPLLSEYEDGEFYVADGTSLGFAIRQWVIHEAGKLEQFREDYREAAAGN